MRDVDEPVAFGRNNSHGVARFESVTQMIGVKGLVGQHGIKRQPFDQRRDPGDFVALAREQLEAHEVAQSIGEGQNFGRQSAFGAPDSLIESPPFAPLAFW